jgi:hypothetical protein
MTFDLSTVLTKKELETYIKLRKKVSKGYYQYRKNNFPKTKKDEKDLTEIILYMENFLDKIKIQKKY